MLLKGQSLKDDAPDGTHRLGAAVLKNVALKALKPRASDEMDPSAVG